MDRFAALLLAVLTAMPAAAQARAAAAAPVASNPIVEIKGVVGQVQIARGEGMPYIEVKRAKESTRVYLGAMHYLIAEDFNPKTGQGVTVRGYKLSDSVVAIQVTLPGEGKTLKFRGENGWPLWRGGPWRGGRRQD